MEQISNQNALAYAAKHQLQLAEQLGFGVHGNIFVARGKSKTIGEGKTAVKAHHLEESYAKERSVYRLLKQANVSNILGFNVPQLIGSDDELLVIEMSIVARPFVLDFAGAYIRQPPEFPEETWDAWEAEKREQFEARWPKAREVLAALEAMDIYMVDVSPNNIGFEE